MNNLANFDWTDTTLTMDEQQNIENLLVEYSDIFARHRFDIGVNQHFKLKLTLNDERPADSQKLPIFINVKYDVTVELALLYKYNIITNLPFPKCASSISAQREPNWRLRLLLGLRRLMSNNK